MEGISDIKMTGIDAKRPPALRKEPYIDLFFKLSHKVPKEWSEDFNSLLAKHKFTARIKADEGLFIETWVRTPDDVAPHVAHLKSKVAECNRRYIAKVLLKQTQSDGANDALSKVSGEQGRLNEIIAGLEFGG